MIERLLWALTLVGIVLNQEGLHVAAEVVILVGATTAVAWLIDGALLGQ